MERIRLLLVDDHVLFRESLGRLLASEPDFDVVGQCGTAQKPLWNSSAGRRSSLVLLDFNLPDLRRQRSGPAWRVAPATQAKILVVTGAIDAAQSSEVLQQGAAGIFLKHNPVGSLLRAIRIVAAGDAWLDRQVIQYLAARAPIATGSKLSRML